NPIADLSECQTSLEWLDINDDQARSTESVITLRDPELGETHQAGYAFQMSRTPLRARAPRGSLDVDRAAILASLDRAPASTTRMAGEQVTAALQGFRVVDLTQILAGPTCGRILAEFGADVTKINAPVGLPVSNHLQVNNGKRTTLIDLKTPAGMDIFWRLIDRADVFLMNFSPSTALRLGLDEDTVRQRRPDIIYSVVSCYGWNGPRANHRGHEQMGQAITGMQERFGRGGPQPVMQSMPICDLGTGNLVALATMLALYHRLRTGTGQRVLGSLAQTATVHQIPFMLHYAGRTPDAAAGQSARGDGPLYRLYRASDRWFFLAAQAVGVDRLATAEGLAGVDQFDGVALQHALRDRFADTTAETWVSRLTAIGVGAHVVRTQAECMEDVWAQAHGLSVAREDPQLGTVLSTGPSSRMSATPPKPMPSPHSPGADNLEVLVELGLGDEYAALVREGVIANSVRSSVARATLVPAGGS
ncbi:MAG: CoA transferase, partial [Chloroflexi bacterium]|nr:CoA transferase [Chloroflexota bacterium]